MVTAMSPREIAACTNRRRLVTEKQSIERATRFGVFHQDITVPTRHGVEYQRSYVAQESEEIALLPLIEKRLNALRTQYASHGR